MNVYIIDTIEVHVAVWTVPTPNIWKISSLASYCTECSKPRNKNP